MRVKMDMTFTMYCSMDVEVEEGESAEEKAYQIFADDKTPLIIETPIGTFEYLQDSDRQEIQE